MLLAARASRPAKYIDALADACLAGLEEGKKAAAVPGGAPLALAASLAERAGGAEAIAPTVAAACVGARRPVYAALARHGVASSKAKRALYR